MILGSKKCFLSFLYQISFFLLEKLYFTLYILRKKKYWRNMGFYIPKIANLNLNNLLYKNLISLNMFIPDELKKDYLRSKIGKKYFKFYFRFFFGLIFFSKYFVSYFNQLKLIMKIRIRNRLTARKHSRYFLRFFQFNNFEFEINSMQKIFNYNICIKLIKTVCN